MVVHPLVPAVSGHPDVAGDSLAVNAFHDDAGNRESHHLLPPDWMNGAWGSKTPHPSGLMIIWGNNKVIPICWVFWQTIITLIITHIITHYRWCFWSTRAAQVPRCLHICDRIYPLGLAFDFHWVPRCWYVLMLIKFKPVADHETSKNSPHEHQI